MAASERKVINSFSIKANNKTITRITAYRLKRRCQNIIKLLRSHESAWPFLEPVNPTKFNLKGYFKVVKHPMDLQTVTVLYVCMYECM